MDIKVERLSKEQFEEKKIRTWPIWEKEVSKFDWHYDSTEECFILQGEVTVTPNNGQPVSFKVGDFVTFSKGLSCKWDIKNPVKKHYRFA